MATELWLNRGLLIVSNFRHEAGRRSFAVAVSRHIIHVVMEHWIFLNDLCKSSISLHL